MSTDLHADLAEIRRVLALFQNPESQATEISAFNVEFDKFHDGVSGKSLKTLVGHFDNPAGPVAEKIASLLDWTKQSRSPEGIYFLLNPANEALAARSLNEFEARAEHRAGDADIILLRYSLIDLDPVRPAGISSTNEEHQAALERGTVVRDFLMDEGWPAPVRADSGNGAHVLPRFADLPNTKENVDLLRRVLKTLSELFSDDVVKVDLTTFNPARISKLYGTIVRKGSDTPTRPHRLSRLLEVPEHYHDNRVTEAQLRAFIDRYSIEPQPAGTSESETQSKPSPSASQSAPLDVEKLLRANGIEYTKKDWQGGWKYILKRCPFNSAHTKTSVAILQFPSRALCFKCQHQSCAGKTWHDVRDVLEPGWGERQKRTPEGGGATASAPGEPAKGYGWDALCAPEFIAQGADIPEMLVPRLAAPGAISVISGTRGLGKTNLGLKLAIASATGDDFLGQVLKPCRVLYLNRDNPTATIRKRLKSWGAEVANNLFILGRDKAAPFREKEVWQNFPLNRYDMVVIDSLSAFLEGTDEKEGGANGKDIASILDAAATSGAAFVILANTKRTGKAFRGSGIIADRADIFFEARDATDLKLNPRREHWIDCLPDPSDEAWEARSKRRKARRDYRIALICTKFRDGDEPEPFIVEIRYDDEAHSTVEDVTAEVEAEHERSRCEAAKARQDREVAAVAALKAALPILKSEAESLLTLQNGISRKGARSIIKQRTGTDWILGGRGTKADPTTLRGIDGGNSGNTNPNAENGSENPILAVPLPQGRQESLFKNDSPTMGASEAVSCRSFEADTKPESAPSPQGGVPCRHCGYHVFDADRVFCPQCSRELKGSDGKNADVSKRQRREAL